MVEFTQASDADLTQARTLRWAGLQRLGSQPKHRLPAGRNVAAVRHGSRLQTKTVFLLHYNLTTPFMYTTNHFSQRFSAQLDRSDGLTRLSKPTFSCASSRNSAPHKTQNALTMICLSALLIAPFGIAFGASVEADFSNAADYTVSNGSAVSISGGLAFLSTSTELTSADITGDGLFTFGVNSADVNGDGHLDLYASNFSSGQQNQLWINDGSGGFSAANIAGDTQSYASIMADLDGDGDIDIVSPSAGGPLVRILLNDGAGSFTAGTSLSSAGSVNRGVASGDVDGDGDIDLYIGTDSSLVQNTLWINNGAGGFTGTSIAGDSFKVFGAVMGDVDGDGDLDLYAGTLASSGTVQQNKLWINDGSGVFSASDITGDDARTYKPAMGDVDGDGDLDIYAPSIGSLPNRLWINDGSGSFTADDLTGDSLDAYGADMGDVDGDGDLDIYVAVNPGQNKLWINDGTGSFSVGDVTGDTAASFDAVLGDIDGDGRADVYVGTSAQNKLWATDPATGGGAGGGASYASSSPYIEPATSTAFQSTLDTFGHVLGSGNQGVVRYQVSTDGGSSWQYWDGSAWSVSAATDGTQTSLAGDVNAQIASLDTDGGLFKWRAYLSSDGSERVELDSVSFTYVSDTTPPVAPTNAPDLQAISDSGASSTDDLTNDATPTLDVICSEVGATLTLYSDQPSAGTGVGTATCVATGTVAITASTTLVDATHSLSYTETDTAGNESAGSPALSVIIDTVAATAPGTPNLQAASDTGASSTDYITSDSTPSLDIACTTGDTVTLLTDLPTANTLVGSGFCVASTLAITHPTVIADGNYPYHAVSTDVAGNMSSSSAVLSVVVVDTGVPAAPSLAPDLQAGSDSGASSTDDVTNDATPTLDAICSEVGATLTLYSDQPSAGTAIGTAICTAIGTVAVTASTTLADATHSLTYTVTDTAGNGSAGSPALSVGVDTSAPLLAEHIPVPTSTRDQTPTYAYTASEEGTLIMGGACSSMATSAGVGTNTITLDSDGVGGNLPAGDYTDCMLTVTDQAGNTSAPLAISAFGVDTSRSGGSSKRIDTRETVIDNETNTATLRGVIKSKDDWEVFFVVSQTDPTPKCYDTTSTIYSLTGRYDDGDMFEYPLTGLEDGASLSVQACGRYSGGTSSLKSGGYESASLERDGLPKQDPDQDVQSSNAPEASDEDPDGAHDTGFSSSDGSVQPLVAELLQEIEDQSSVGATTVCAPYLTETIALARSNSPSEVNKLITFLNTHQGENLREDGSYDADDFEAVKRFQVKYRSSVLDIWGLEQPTGYVYLTTRNKINAFYCNKALTCPVFTEHNSHTTNNTSPETRRTKVLLTELGYYSGSINTRYDFGLQTAVKGFQETFPQTMLHPWGLTRGTGYKYKTTNRFLNALVGCELPPEILENGAVVAY